MQNQKLASLLKRHRNIHLKKRRKGRICKKKNFRFNELPSPLPPESPDLLVKKFELLTNSNSAQIDDFGVTVPILLGGVNFDQTCIKCCVLVCDAMF